MQKKQLDKILPSLGITATRMDTCRAKIDSFIRLACDDDQAKLYNKLSELEELLLDVRAAALDSYHLLQQVNKE